MTVADLIHLLQQHDPVATVLLWEHAPYEGRLSMLGVGEVRPIELGTRESIGLLQLEPWGSGDDGQQGPFPSLVLGSTDARPVPGH